MKSMTDWQAVALKHPCYLGEETARPRFAHADVLGSIVLSVNSGYE